jgi:hypothetical protein
MIELKDLFYGTPVIDENEQKFIFINHCFCSNNSNPDLTFSDQDGNLIGKKLTEIQEKGWKILA